MPRGGPREGTPGARYTNRTDLAQNRQPVRTPTGLPYGEAKRRREAQEQIPLPQLPRPGQVRLDAPSDRPDEPVTAGMPFGPGPGPEVLPPETLAPPDDVGLIIRELYRLTRYPDLLPIIEALDAQGR